MSDVLVLNEGISKRGGRKKMRKASFRRYRMPRLREGIGSFGDFGMGMGDGLGRRRRVRRFRFRRFPRLRMNNGVGSPLAVPWKKGTTAHKWFKRRMSDAMYGVWGKYKRGKRRYLPVRPMYAPSARATLHLGADDVGLQKMSQGWLPGIDLLGTGTMGLGLVSVFAVPKLPFIPDVMKTGFGRIGTQLLTGIAGHAVIAKLFNRPDLGNEFFKGALAGTIVDILNTQVLKTNLLASGLSGLGVYVKREQPVSTGVYMEREGMTVEADDEDDDE